MTRCGVASGCQPRRFGEGCAITRRLPPFCGSLARFTEDLCPAVAKPVPALRDRLCPCRPGFRRQRTVGSVASAGFEAEDRRRVHRQDQGVPAGSADHDRARRSPAGLGHGPDAAQVLQPHRRHARRADVRQGHLPLLRRARQGVRPHRGVAHRQDRGRPRHGAARGGRRGDDQAAGQVQGDAGVADRSAEDDRGSRRSS